MPVRVLAFLLPPVLLCSSLCADPFIRGDTNEDMTVDVSDAIKLLSALFVMGAPQLSCNDSGDVNDDALLDVSDAIYLLSHLFVIGAPPPLAPFPDPGFDPTPADPWTCGDEPPPTGQAWVLIADMGGFLRIAPVDEVTGDLGATIDSTLTGASRPFDVEATPNGQYVYVVDLDNGIHMLAFDPSTGTAVTLPGSPLGLGGFATRMVEIDSTGSFLYVGRSAEVRGFEIDASTGQLTEITGSPWPAGSTIAGMGIDPSDSYLYATSSGDDAIYGFSIDSATGALASLTGSPWPDPNPMGEVMQIAITSGSQLYTMNAPNPVGPGSVTGWDMMAAGDLSPMPLGPWLTGADASWSTAVSPCATNDAFVIAGHSSSSFISVLSRDLGTGDLMAVAGSPFGTSGSSISIAITDTASRVYSVSWNSGSVDAWDLNATTGELTPTPLSPFALGGPLRGMTIVGP